MRHIDRRTNFESLPVSDEVRAILRATAYNEQLQGAKSDNEDHYTTQSIKYAQRNKRRPRYRKYETIERAGDRDYGDILELLGFEDTALEFQLDSWDELETAQERAQNTGRDQGLVISANTGFGKTGCFMGHILNRLVENRGTSKGSSRGATRDAAIFVYPSKALLHDQLTRVLEIFHGLKEQDQDIPSIGIWYGNTPYKAQNVTNTSKSTAANRGSSVAFTGAKHWDEDAPDRTLYLNTEGSRSYTIDDSLGETLFDSTEFYIARQTITSRNPNLLLTTLESLENVAMKPHYDLVTNADYFVFDEIHQYSGLRGAHASNVIENVKRIRYNAAAEPSDAAGVFVGSSATVDDPGRFGRKLFGMQEGSKIPTESGDTEYEYNDLRTITPSESDIDDTNDDKQHYYFMLTPRDEESPEVASQFIQHAMMIGHSLLEDDPDTVPPNVTPSRSTILSFIDSKSLLRNLDTKFVNADRDRTLWEHHFGTNDPGDWGRLASESGHLPLDDDSMSKPLNIYSGSQHNIDQIERRDLTLGTKYLEVGVDIDTLEHVINYREPQTVAALEQRAGRAARKRGDAHMYTLLSSYAGDTNFYYRADGFVDRDVTTPLRTDNRIVEWFHDKFYTYHQVLHEVNQKHKWTGKETLVLKTLFEELGWDLFFSFLDDPSVHFNQFFDQNAGTRSLIDGNVGPAMSVLSEIKRDISDFLDKFHQVAEIEGDEIMLRRDGATTFVTTTVENIRDRLESYEEFLDTVAEETAQIETQIETAMNALEDAHDEEELEPRAEAVRSVVEDHLYLIVSKLRPVAREAHSSSELELDIDEISSDIDLIIESIEQDELKEKNAQRRIAYYLENCLDQIDEYHGIYWGHGSLYAMKYLFRAAYYFEKALRVSRTQEASSDESEPVMGDIWYVPPNYFSDTGWYFDLEDPDGDSESVSVDKLLTQYTPMRTEYASSRTEYGNLDTMYTFQPNIFREDGDLQFEFSAVQGSVHNGVTIPDKIPLTQVTDRSEHMGQKIVEYNSSNYELISDMERTLELYESIEKGQVYASSQITTQVKDPDENVDTKRRKQGSFRLHTINAQAWIEAVDLEITPADQTGGGLPYPDYDAEPITERIHRDNTKLGYSLNTRGVTWNLKMLINALPGAKKSIDLSQLGTNRYKDLSETSPETVVCHTAAHLLTVWIADVAGVNVQNLMYAIDRPNDSSDADLFRVHTFEQIEGGQGIVDLFWEALETRPEDALASLYQLTRNSQVLNERLWADESSTTDAWQRIYSSISLDRLRSDDEDVRSKEESKLANIITETLGYSYAQTVNRVSNEVITTVDHIHQLHESSSNLRLERLYELKAALARDRIANTEDNQGENIPARTEQKFEDCITDLDKSTIEDVLLSPDIDGCEANLHLKQTISDQPQSELLSDTVLAPIEEWLVERVPADEELTTIHDRTQITAHRDDEWAYFLDL